MEIAVFWLFTVFALGTEIEQAQEETAALASEVGALESQVDQLELQTLKLSGAHSSLYALTRAEREAADEKIEALADQINQQD